MQNRIEEIFFSFQNFPPKNPIIRNNTPNDAYPIYVFESLFAPYHKIKKIDENNPEHRELLLKSIVAPQDDQIDIFFEVDDIDEKTFHVVQVKNQVLRPQEIESSLNAMEFSINTYIKSPKTLAKNLKDIISETTFSREDKNNCHFYVVHSGNTKNIRNQKKNHNILSFSDLDLIQKGIENECVPFAQINIDTKSNFIINNFIDNKDRPLENFTNKPKSILCNFNGYDLAKLNNDYASTLAGRNILYGQNLREALTTKSKTYESMFSTINSEPELFLFYNNGITILCSDFNINPEENSEKIKLKNFSIINGAQTTSTLGDYLKEALAEENQSKIENLRKVFVLTKIYEINSSLKEHEKIGENIRIFTNTQTPLSNRDMVSIRSEQIKIQKRFLENIGYPNIFITIKNGENPPSYPPLFKYQIITNERLAQLCFAGPLLDPFTAKDKRSKLFNVEQQDGVTLNPLYHKIFDPQSGLLFKMNNVEVDELLFLNKLHEDSKRFHQNTLKERLKNLTQSPNENEIDKKTRPERIDLIKRHQEIAAVFIFHNLAGFYCLKQNFDSTIENANKLVFNSRQYYNNNEFRQEIITLFYNLIYKRSIRIIAENSGIENVQNWTRSSNGASIYLRKINEQITLDSYEISKEYKQFIAKAKCVN